MKKQLISVTLVLAFLLSLSMNAFALNTTTSEQLKIQSVIDEVESVEYDFFTIDFESEDRYALSPNSNVFAASRISQVKEFVQSLDLESKGFIGLDTAIYSELDSLFKEGVQLESYGVALPRMTTEYYGHYDGFMFQAAYTYHTETYEEELYGASEMQDFIEGTINILMNYTFKRISVPYSILTSFGGDPIITDAAVTSLRNTDDVITRYIMIQDLNQQASLDQYAFVPVIMDGVRISQTTVVMYPAGAYGTSTMSETEPVEIATQYFYDKNYNLNSGYNHYMAGNVADPITYFVPLASFSWEPAD